MGKRVLAIETSCDDTSLALLEEFPGHFPTIHYHQSFSQEHLLRKWGGVVPEIASRYHLGKIPYLLDDLNSRFDLQSIDGVAVTNRPGLLGPLLVGTNLAKSLSLFLECPVYPANHLMAHLEAIHLHQSVTYPYLGLLVSGGHTLLTRVESSYHWKILGSTRDDAAGEAFDKGGKLLGLPYPAGKHLDELAQKGDAEKFSFTMALAHEKKFTLSFSGLKTALKYLLEKNPDLLLGQNFYDLCASYQEAIVQSLVHKLSYPCLEHPHLPLVVGGGVACNSRLKTLLKQKIIDRPVYFVKPEYCTDNAAMIGNLALRDPDHWIPFPLTLELDAESRVFDKSQFE